MVTCILSYFEVTVTLIVDSEEGSMVLVSTLISTPNVGTTENKRDTAIEGISNQNYFKMTLYSKIKFTEILK